MSFIKKYHYPLIYLLVTSALLFFFSDASFSISLRICTEVFLICIFVCAISNNYLRSTLWIIYNLVLSSQINSVISTGEFLIPLTILNIEEASAVGNEALFKIILVTILYFSLSLLIIKQKKLKLGRFLIAPVIISLLFTGPIRSSISTLYYTYKQVSYHPSYNYFDLDQNFLKHKFYDTSTLPDSLQHIKKSPNIIVIFSEGLSSIVIDKNNNKALNLTPNISSAYEEGFYVDNYFNHTAATFRGLRGQLISGYQYRDGITKQNNGLDQINKEKVKKMYSGKLISLPEILNNHGYHTYFISSTERDSNLNSLLASMPFHKVFGMEDFNWSVNDRMSDKASFKALSDIVSSMDTNDQPFFIGIYPSGTHHGLDSPDTAYMDGKNSYYNKFHNLDEQIGSFISWFRSSKYYDDTILILTGDHSTFPTPEFKKSFGTNNSFFVDKIPFMILGKSIKHDVFDAKGKNSLSLAPTILNIIGINAGDNYFLGCSLFDIDCNNPLSNISAIGDIFFSINPDSKGNYTVTPLEDHHLIRLFYHISG
ncbi:Sulfatase [Methylobacillus rhizosphaerae]|uniref:Sulfatase n=1 Tax=Methylobacillus rhizosphaerae TaxID=551994 RepID=A0A239AW11_9PROT|nr:LTA synthase family protein [Methylobacillus rhizosphaerae]SNR99522.1 Sulfatase [Methylobacillus rhizosphaerae]